MSDSGSGSTALAQTIVAIVAGAAVVVCAIVLIVIIMFHKERKIRQSIEQQAQKIHELQVRSSDEPRPFFGA